MSARVWSIWATFWLVAAVGVLVYQGREIVTLRKSASDLLVHCQALEDSDARLMAEGNKLTRVCHECSEALMKCWQEDKHICSWGP